MFWNHLIHILAGIFGATIFAWSGPGILTTAIVAGLSQAVDTVRMYFYHRNRILKTPPEVREEQIGVFKEGATYKLAQLYVVKVVWYGLVILLAAFATRSFSA